MIIIIKSARIIQGQEPEETASSSMCADFSHEYFSLIRIHLSDIKHFI
jgi:hypothetical protein